MISSVIVIAYMQAYLLFSLLWTRGSPFISIAPPDTGHPVQSITLLGTRQPDQIITPVSVEQPNQIITPLGTEQPGQVIALLGMGVYLQFTSPGKRQPINLHLFR
jgi:hypothetical protein